MDFNVNFQGLEQLQKTFDRLPRAMERRVYRQSLRAGLVPVRDAATQNISQVSSPFTGLLSKKSSLAIYNLKKYQGNFRSAVGIRKRLLNIRKKDKDGNPVRVGLYASVLEHGSPKMNRQPRPWLKNAIREKKDAAVQAVVDDMKKRINSAIEDAKR